MVKLLGERHWKVNEILVEGEDRRYKTFVKCTIKIKWLLLRKIYRILLPYLTQIYTIIKLQH